MNIIGCRSYPVMRHTNNGASRNKCVIEGVEVVPKWVDITPEGVIVAPKGVIVANREAVKAPGSMQGRPEVDPSRFGVDQEGIEVTVEWNRVIVGVQSSCFPDWGIKEWIWLQELCIPWCCGLTDSR